MHRVVLDTDIFAEVLKGRNALIRKRARAYRAAFGHYTITSITVMEIVYGRRKDGN
jgi:tRNA(fMet)-specific endonuclease VapC